MTRPVPRIASFFRELKRRKVYQVTAAYVLLAAAGLELVDILVPSTSLPEFNEHGSSPDASCRQATG